MNKLFKTISLSLITVLAAGLMMVPTTQAVEPPLDVEFETDPLFLNADLKPGDSITRWVKVTNHSGETKPVATEAINYPNPVPSDDLSRALNIVIKKGSSELYNSSLYNFYLAGETFLSNINDGETIQYDFTISFPADKGNEWQTKTTYFDILVGFQGQESPPPGPGPDRPSGGSRAIPPGLTIFEESVQVTCDCNCNAVINWTTNYTATSQVIYAAEGEAHDLDLTDALGTPPKYGYAHTSPEYNTLFKVIDHSVVLTGLTPNTTYYFRAVSHASPATISLQNNFSTGDCQCEEEIVPPEEPGEPGEPEEELGIGAGGPVEVPEEESEEIALGPGGNVLAAGEEEAEEKGFLGNLLASIADALRDFFSGCNACFPWWLILVLAIYPLIKFLASRQPEEKGTLIPAKKPDKKIEMAWFGWFIFLVGLAVYFYLTNHLCIAVWIFLVLALITLLIRYYFLKEPEEKENKKFILGLIIIFILFILWLYFRCLPWWLLALALVIYFFGADLLKKEPEKKAPPSTPLQPLT